MNNVNRYLLKLKRGKLISNFPNKSERTKDKEGKGLTHFVIIRIQSNHESILLRSMLSSGYPAVT